MIPLKAYAYDVCTKLYKLSKFIEQLMNLYLQVSLLEENIKPRTDLPPLLVHLRERRPEKLHYLGVSFGLTLDLLRFWKKHKFAPFYICQIPVTMSLTYLLLSPS